MKNPSQKLFVLFLSACFLAACETGNDPSSVQLKDHNDSLSYIIGSDYANVLKANGYEPNPEAFYKGFYNTINGKDDFPDSVKLVFFDEINKQSQEKQQEQILARIHQNKEDGARFMAQNKIREGVIQLPDGLQYRILKKGNGPTPAANDSVLIHYRAMFIDGSTFDESYQRGPQGVRLSKLTSGLSGGLQLMNTGSIYELFIPSGLAYGDEGIPNVMFGGETLIYNVELIKIY